MGTYSEYKKKLPNSTSHIKNQETQECLIYTIVTPIILLCLGHTLHYNIKSKIFILRHLCNHETCIVNVETPLRCDMEDAVVHETKYLIPSSEIRQMCHDGVAVYIPKDNNPHVVLLTSVCGNRNIYIRQHNLVVEGIASFVRRFKCLLSRHNRGSAVSFFLQKYE